MNWNIFWNAWFVIALAFVLIGTGCNSPTEPVVIKITDLDSQVRLYEFEGRRYLVNSAGGILEIRE